MKLFYSKTSPFARKVRATAILLGLESRIALIETDPFSDPPELLHANPLGLIPTLVTPDGFTFFDSPVICEYLNGIAKNLPIIPPAGAARWVALRLQGLGDGVMDAAVLRRKLAVQAGLAEDQAMVARQRAAISRTLDVIEQHPMTRHIDIGQVAIACALGYLDFRFPEESWRETRPLLAAWFEEIGRQDFLRLTDPAL